jgi:hypothetical protein
MVFTSRKAKFFGFLAIGIVAISLLTYGVARYFAIKLKPVVKKELRQVVKNATQQLYHIDFDRVSINFLSGNAYLTNVKIKADTAVYNELVKLKLAPNNLYDIELNRLEIKNVHPLKIYFKRVLEINQILFDGPKIVMSNRALPFNEVIHQTDEKPAYDYIKGFFSSLHVKSIDFKDARFSYVDHNGTKEEIDTVINIDISLKDWLIDEHSAKDTSRFYLLKDAYVYLNDYNYATPDSLYFIKASQFEFSASSKKLNIKSFEVQPRYSEKDFAKAKGFATDRYSLRLNDINFSNIDLHAYIRNREVVADLVSIENGMLSVFNDSSLPKRSQDKTGRFPHQLLQKIKIPLTFKEVLLNKLDISYAEMGKKSGEKGSITFNQTSGLITNVTNQKKHKKINPIIEVNLESYLMRQGKLNVGFKFDLLAPKADFSYKGQLLNMDGRQLNYITKPLAMVEVKSAMIRKLAFDVKANQDVAKGKIEFTYNNLAIGLMKQHEGGERLKRLGLLSLLTNAMVIYSDNPSDGGQFTIAPVYYEREPTSSFFSFIWKTLFQGVKYSIGFTPKKEAEIKQHVKRFETLKDDRERRKLRRELRKLRER